MVDKYVVSTSYLPVEWSTTMFRDNGLRTAKKTRNMHEHPADPPQLCYQIMYNLSTLPMRTIRRGMSK